MKKIISLTIAMAMAAISPAFAASHSTTVFIEEQDVNSDGKVTVDEFKMGRSYEFAKIDYNQDGTLSEVEYIGEYEGRLMLRLSKIGNVERRKEEQQRQMRQAKVRFNVLDSDQNGIITREEHMESGLRMFNLHDQDKDSAITDKDIELAATAKKNGSTDDFINP